MEGKKRKMGRKKKQNVPKPESIEQIIDDLTLFDDDLMSMVFDGNIPAAGLLLRIILKRDDLQIISVVAQKELENPIVGGRNIRLDILVQEKEGKIFNVEVQRNNEGANEKRARFHSSMIDSRMLKAGQEFKELRDSYVILITEKDYFGYGLPIYTVNRYLEELAMVFRDGSHIIYVNGTYQGNNEIGKLMHDFRCKNAKDMNYPELAEGVKHFKEEGGREVMCEAVEAYAARRAEEAAQKAAEEERRKAEEAIKKAEEEAKRAEEAAKKAVIKATIEEGIVYNIDKERILLRVCEKYGIGKEEAEEIYERCLVAKA